MKSAMGMIPLLIAVAMLSAGCGSDRPAVVPVSGVVTFDGKPLANVAIAFMPVEGGRFGYGATNDQGAFVIGTYSESDGATLGSHRITITGQSILAPAAKGRTQAELEAMEERGEPVWIEDSRVPKKYASPDTSGLQVEVKKGMQPLQLQVSK